MAILIFIITLLMLSAQTIADNTEKTPIELSPLSLWQEKKFVEQTHYSVIEENGTASIMATSNGTASMLLQKITIDLTKTPYLNWQWKVENTFKNLNEKEKSGDDYPARIYIAIPNAFLSVYPRALNYVWASQSPQNTYWKNPYTDDVIMLAVQSGDINTGKWISEKRNLREDLKNVFGKDFNKIKGVAIMTDTDNLQAAATAFYKNIYFSGN